MRVMTGRVTRLALLGLPCLSLLLALTLGSAAALAEEATAEEEQEIIVIAPRIIEEARLPLGRGVRVSMSYAVSYADLDPRDAEDREELEGRIIRAATEICERLSEMYPDGEPGASICTRRAIEEAMTQLEEMLAAA